MKFGIFVLLILLFGSTTMFAQKANNCEVAAFVTDKSSGVNVRENTGTNYGIIKTIPRDSGGTLVFIEGAKGDWLKISSAVNSKKQKVFEGTGWIYAPLVSVRLPNQVENLNVYRSASFNGEKIGYTSFGINVEVHGCQENWIKVRLPVTGTGVSDQKLFGWVTQGGFCGSPWEDCESDSKNREDSDPFNNKIIPILDTEIGSILGGTNTKGFYLVSAKETYEYIKNRTDEISFNSFVPVADYQTNRKITKFSKAQENCENFYPLTLDKPVKGILIGTNMDWQPDYPQPEVLWKKQNGKYWQNATYKKAVADFLKTQGIANPTVQIVETLKINLDADDQSDEVIINAQYFKDKSNVFKMNKGDYHVVLVRKVVNGKVKNIIIDGDFANGGAVGAIMEHEIGGVLDLDGNGDKEIILRTKVPEGRWTTVHVKEGNGYVEVLRTGCSA